jgi:hypothetical protein
MNSVEIILACLISLVFGFAASWLFWFNQRGREKRIRQKIAEIEYKEKLLDSIGNGYKNLLRHAFKSIAFSLFLVFSSVTLILALKLIPMPEFFVKFIWSMSVPMWGAAAAICLSTFNEIASLNNLDLAKSKLRKQKEKLEEKL